LNTNFFHKNKKIKRNQYKIYIIIFYLIMFEVSKPFIIRPNGRPRDNVIPPEHELFNVTIEKRV